MPRDSSGTYTPSPSSPFVTGTPIAASAANMRAADVGSEITDSLSRSGKGGMLAALVFTGISAAIKGGIADGASAVAAIIDNVGALSNAAAKLLSIRNNGVEKAYFDKDGALSGASAAAVVRGTAADGATAVGVALDAATVLANASAKLVSVRNAGTEKAYFDKDGVLFMGTDQAATNTTTTGTLTAGTGWTINAQSVKKNSGGLVTVWLDISGGATPTAFQGAQLPAGYRPPAMVQCVVYNQTDNTSAFCGIDATGWIYPPNTANKRYSIMTSFYV